MARSAKQYENQIKVVIVAILSKEFKKSSIVSKVIGNAKSNNQVATKGLVNPSRTGSIVPSRDDRWLVNPDAVVVRVGSVKYGVPEVSRISLKIRYGLAQEYYWLTKESPNSIWRPSGTEIVKWIRAKGSRGNFKYRGRSADLSKDYQVQSIGYLISRSIGKKGISKTNLFNPFKNKKDGVEATVDRALPKIYDRLILLYGTESEDVLVKMLEIFK